MTLKIKVKNLTHLIGELAELCWATKSELPNKPLHIISNFKPIIQGLTTHLPKWEAKGFIRITHKGLFKVAIAALRMRTTLTSFQRLKGHNNSRDPGKEKANKLAHEGASKAFFDEPDLSIEQKFNLGRAQILVLIQALAYEGICKQKTLKYKRGLDMMLDITRHVIVDAFGVLPSDQKTWKSIHSKDLLRSFKAFLWKTLHNMHKVGNYWENIPNWEHQLICKSCNLGATVNLDHIMLECEATRQDLI